MLQSCRRSDYAWPCFELLVVIIASLQGGVYAAPSPHYSPEVTNRRADTAPSDGKNLSPQVWIPIIIVAVLVVVAALVCGRRGWRARIASWTTGAALASGTVIRGNRPGSTVLTAEQLAGTTDDVAPATTGSGNGTNGNTTRAAPRRNRRTRRTPSQMSTTSLPAYMKDPGEHELVIIRGPEDMEDVTPTMVEMPLSNDTTLVYQDISSTTSLTRNPQYTRESPSPNDQPLLHPNMQRRSSGGDGNRALSNRPSYDTLSSEDADSAALVRAHPVPPALEDSRGAAPPYFEVVSTEDLDRTISISTDQEHQSVPSAVAQNLGVSSSPQPPQNTSSRIRSSILGIFNSRNQASMTSPPVPSSNQLSPALESRGSHRRSDSRPSVISMASTSEGVQLTHVRSRSRPTTPGHRPSHSGNQSMFSISSSAFRPLSRARSRSHHHLNGNDGNPLTSPSMISLNSISAPLTHTAVKTSVMYPKGGPTPDQLKLISSRESFAKFGVPYGPDAIAFASQSRLSLGPPPGFEEVVGPSQAGPSGEASRPDSRIGSESPEPEESAATSSSTIAARPTSAIVESVIPELSTTMNIPRPLSPSNTATPTMLEVPQTSVSTVIAPAPPSAFKDPASPAPLPIRAESRASSYMSFTTAEESLPPSRDSISGAASPTTPIARVSSSTPTITIARVERAGAKESDMTPSTTVPPTPRMSSRHLHENTDTTITPSSS